MQDYDFQKLEFVGYGLARPECALAHQSGLIFAPDWTGNGGISVIYPDGSVKRHLAQNLPEMLGDEALRPNGICLLEGGDFLLAHLGDTRGGIFRLAADGMVTPIFTQIEGEILPPTNFVTVDDMNRTWITVSTRKTPRALAYRSDVADGFIALIENGTARIVADNLGYTNECLPHPDGKRVFVNETFARKLTSFDIGRDGGLTNRQTIASFDVGTFPDGLAFDEIGAAWITSIVSNRILRVDLDGNIETFMQDVDPEHLAWVEEAWRTHTMGRPHLDTVGGRYLRNVSNLAFCGEKLDQAVLGCLSGDKLAKMEMPVKGARPVHWTFNIDPLIKTLDTISPIMKIET